MTMYAGCMLDADWSKITITHAQSCDWLKQVGDEYI